MGDPAAVPYLLAALNTQHNPFIRHRVLEALGIIGDPSVIPDLERASAMAEKAKDRETTALAKLAVLENKRDKKGIEEVLATKRIKDWHKGPAEAALARLLRDEQEEQERQASLLPS